MKKYIAALYTNGRVVTGCNHGDAFSKLSVAEQDSDLESGFYDAETGQFLTEEYDFYLKQIFLIRHGEAQGNQPEADLTDIGVLQVQKTAEFLAQHNLADFEAFTSPYLRCLHTAEIISGVTGLKFSVDVHLRERISCQEYVESHQFDYPQFSWPENVGWEIEPETSRLFLDRINETLAFLPTKTVYIAHADFIVNFTEQAIGHRITESDTMPGGAVTFIDAKKYSIISPYE